MHVLEARAGYAGKCSVCAGIVRESSLARALDGVGYEAEQLRIGGGHVQWSRGRDTGGAFVRRPAAEVVEQHHDAEQNRRGGERPDDRQESSSATDPP